MNRREVITVLGCAAVTWPLAARAQAPAAPRIGLLSIGAVPERPVVWDSFFERMRELGYEDSQNIVYIRGFAAGHAERMEAMIHEVVAAKPALLVVTGAVEARAVQRVNPPMPCVMFLAADPVGSGLVPSLARPGGRFTGLTTMDLELDAKRVDLLREALPAFARAQLLTTGSRGPSTREALPWRTNCKPRPLPWELPLKLYKRSRQMASSEQSRRPPQPPSVAYSSPSTLRTTPTGKRLSTRPNVTACQQSTEHASSQQSVG